jgi:protein TonB
LFDQTFVNVHGQTRRPWTVAISLALQTAVIAVALIVPLLHVASLDLPQKLPILLPYQKVDLKVKPEVKPAPNRTPALVRHIFPVTLSQGPTSIPRHIDMTPDAPEIANSAPTGTAGPIGAFLTGVAIAPPIAKAAVVKSPPSLPAAPVHVGGEVQAAKLIFGPKPTYPALGRATRTQGTVRIQAVIGRDGSIGHLQVVSGPPLLVAAALEAVQQWRYQPTLLNGQPVEVITEIDVNFTLQ